LPNPRRDEIHIAKYVETLHRYVWGLAAIDILSQYPVLAENFLRSIKPSDIGQIPAHPVAANITNVCWDEAFCPIREEMKYILRSMWRHCIDNASSQQTFVMLAAIDILSQYPVLAENFLRSIKPSEIWESGGQ
jgi:hypothetical protein